MCKVDTLLSVLSLLFCPKWIIIIQINKDMFVPHWEYCATVLQSKSFQV